MKAAFTGFKGVLLTGLIAGVCLATLVFAIKFFPFALENEISDWSMVFSVFAKVLLFSIVFFEVLISLIWGWAVWSSKNIAPEQDRLMSTADDMEYIMKPETAAKPVWSKLYWTACTIGMLISFLFGSVVWLGVIKAGTAQPWIIESVTRLLLLSPMFFLGTVLFAKKKGGVKALSSRTRSLMGLPPLVLACVLVALLFTMQA